MNIYVSASQQIPVISRRRGNSDTRKTRPTVVSWAEEFGLHWHGSQ